MIKMIASTMPSSHFNVAKIDTPTARRSSSRFLSRTRWTPYRWQRLWSARHRVRWKDCQKLRRERTVRLPRKQSGMNTIQRAIHVECHRRQSLAKKTRRAGDEQVRVLWCMDRRILSLWSSTCSPNHNRCGWVFLEDNYSFIGRLSKQRRVTRNGDPTSNGNNHGERSNRSIDARGFIGQYCPIDRSLFVQLDLAEIGRHIVLTSSSR